MILVDTSIWIDHLRVGEEGLVTLLNSTQVLCHPFIDAHLLAAVSLAGPARLWTRDKRLGAVATDLGLAYETR